MTSKSLPLLNGNLYKLNKRGNKRRKFFVIFGAEPESFGNARLEYFENEKDFGKLKSRRKIFLGECIKIIQRFDTKYQNVIGIYQKDSILSIITKNEIECENWLRILLILYQESSFIYFGELSDRFWNVVVLDRGWISSSYGIVGNFRISITESTLKLARVESNHRVVDIEFSLSHIKRCSVIQSILHIEIARSLSIGVGELWLETFDPVIAENIKKSIQNISNITQHEVSSFEESNSKGKNHFLCW